MSSLCRSYECMNIVRVNIGFFTGFKKIKQRRISFVLGYLRHIRTILVSLPVNYLKDLRYFGLDKGGVDLFSPKYRLSSIICEVASFRLVKPVRSEPPHDDNRKFLHIPFANKGIDAINNSNILNRKEVVKEIHHITKINMFPLSPIATLTALAVKFSTTKKHCKILT